MLRCQNRDENDKRQKKLHVDVAGYSSRDQLRKGQYVDFGHMSGHRLMN